MGVITDIDFIKNPLEGDDYQLVYGVLYCYGKYEIDEVDSHLNNLLVDLCNEQPTKVLRKAKSKKWIRILQSIVDKLKSFKGECVVHIPHCKHYFHPITETQEQFLLAISVLEDFLSMDFNNMEYIDSLDNAIVTVPSLYELFDDFRGLNKNSDTLIFGYLRNQLKPYFRIRVFKEEGKVEVEMDSNINECINSIYTELINKAFDDDLMAAFKSVFHNIIPDNAESFSEQIISFYKLNILKDDCIGLMYDIQHPINYYSLITEEMYRRGLIGRIEAKTEYYDEDLYKKLFLENNSIGIETSIVVNDEEQEQENIKKPPTMVARVGVLYYMLHDEIESDLLYKVTSYVIDKDLHPNNSSYKYIHSPHLFQDEKNAKYIKKQLERFELSVPEIIAKYAK